LLEDDDVRRWNERRGDIGGIGGGEPDVLRSEGASIRVRGRLFDGVSSSAPGKGSVASSDNAQHGVRGEDAASPARFKTVEASEAVLWRRGISIFLMGLLILAMDVFRASAGGEICSDPGSIESLGAISSGLSLPVSEPSSPFVLGSAGIVKAGSAPSRFDKLSTLCSSSGSVAFDRDADGLSVARALLMGDNTERKYSAGSAS
jgi:hypothetical protein